MVFDLMGGNPPLLQGSRKKKLSVAMARRLLGMNSAMTKIFIQKINIFLR